MDKEKRNLWTKLVETVGVCVVQTLTEILLKREKGEDDDREKEQ